MSSESESEVLITVVMAFYKGDNFCFFKRAVESVLCQTWKNLEFILVADGDISSSQKEYLDHISDDRVKLIQISENQGPAKARNEGIKASCGEYIAIMDADDICSPDRLKYQYQELVSRKLDVIGSQYELIDKDENVISIKKLPCCENVLKSVAPFFNPINNPTAFAKSEVFKSNLYEESLRLGEDYRMWINLILKGYKLGNTKNILLKFRGAEFLNKRRGIGWALSDFKNRVYAHRLVGYLKKPLVIMFAFLIFISRLFPSKILKLTYGFKNYVFSKI
eukprot:GHVO01062263.1.p1 GENE.GHVO01062263.1~~GHVO01062263.1.p1  ORF type:complete len:279 (+),score=-1.67 GHVO01062263.1:489-1325(+)